MDAIRPGRGARAGVAADIEHRKIHRSQAWIDERPRPHILRFFLNPNPILGPAKAVQCRSQRLLGPGIQLFDADDGHIAQFALRSLFLQVVKHFAAAEEDAPYALGLGGRVADHPLK